MAIQMNNLPSNSMATLPKVPEAGSQRIQEAAYFKAEKRGFAPGRELDDWLDAEVDTFSASPVFTSFVHQAVGLSSAIVEQSQSFATPEEANDYVAEMENVAEDFRKLAAELPSADHEHTPKQRQKRSDLHGKAAALFQLAPQEFGDMVERQGQITAQLRDEFHEEGVNPLHERQESISRAARPILERIQPQSSPMSDAGSLRAVRVARIPRGQCEADCVQDLAVSGALELGVYTTVMSGCAFLLIFAPICFGGATVAYGAAVAALAIKHDRCVKACRNG